MWPLLPMPVTTTRPRMAAIISTQRSKRSSRQRARSSSASASARSTRQPAAIVALGARSGSVTFGNGMAIIFAASSTLPVIARTPPCGRYRAPNHGPALGPSWMPRQRRHSPITCVLRQYGHDAVMASTQGTCAASLLIREDVHAGPTCKVEPGAMRQEREAGCRQLDAEQVLAQVLEAMAVGIGAGELGCDLGAIDRPAHHAQVVLQDREIEAREVEHLLDRGIGQQTGEVGRVVAAVAEMHEMTRAVSGGQLHQAQPVTERVEPHRLGVDGDARPEVEIRRQVLLVLRDRHRASAGPWRFEEVDPEKGLADRLIPGEI